MAWCVRCCYYSNPASYHVRFNASTQCAIHSRGNVRKRNVEIERFSWSFSVAP